MVQHIVRYGAMRFLGVFKAADGNQYRRGESVIVRTDRGLEAGEVLCEASRDAIQRIRDPAEGQILRHMTSDDAHEVTQIKDQTDQELEAVLSPPVASAAEPSTGLPTTKIHDAPKLSCANAVPSRRLGIAPTSPHVEAHPAQSASDCSNRRSAGPYPELYSRPATALRPGLR